MMLKHMLHVLPSALLLLLLAAPSALAGLYGKSSAVKSLDHSSFNAYIKQHDLVLVEFYAPWCGHCKALQPEWEKLAKQAKGAAYRVAALDCDDERNKPLAGRYGIQGFPTIKLFKSGKPVDYQGARDARSIASWVKQHVPSYVTTLTAAEHDAWLADVADVPKALLFSEKRSVSAFYKAQSAVLRGRLDLGFVPSSESSLCERYGVTTFPALLAVTADGPVPFEGAKLTASSGTAFLRSHALEGDDDGEEAVPQLHDQSCLKAHCLARGNLCAMLVVGGDPKGPEARRALERMRQADAARADAHFQMVWVEGAKQPAFLEAAFGVAPADYAQLVVFSAKKRAFVTFQGALSSPEKINGFLDRVLRGKAKTRPCPDFPELAGATKRCKAAPPPPPPPPKKEKKKQPKQSSGGGGGSDHGFGGPGATRLTASNFRSEVMEGADNWIVAFYAPWCGHCKNLAPQWRRAAKQAKGLVRFGYVDATEHGSLAQRYGVKGYPTIKLFKAGAKKSPQDYQGAREAPALVRGALGMLSVAHTARLKTAAAVDSLLGGAGDKPTALLFASKAGVPPLLRAVATRHHEAVQFGCVPKNAPEADALRERFGVGEVPALVFVSPDGTRQKAHGGALDFETLSGVAAAAGADPTAFFEGSQSCGGGGGGDGQCTAPPPGHDEL